MLISQKKAIAKLRAETNLSFETCTETVRKLAVHKDGRRMKVNVADLEQKIGLLNLPTPEPIRKGTVRPLSRRMAATLRTA